ncbi:MAG: bifunctional glutamate N-acetyltransferase/amino-acid acetyltransferase ArgJ [Acidobacteriia bacterium]|nr:bifunctional glutamate N-acetyltransferase/amino-acid acetyltransferase ArgJ [Terriglobia bacterium]
MRLASKILLPRGFEFSAATAGIKVSGSPDLALALAPHGANAAAMFTTNRVVAIPLQCGREHLRKTGGRVRAVVVNSGNANCATGDAGRFACERVCGSVAKAAGCEQDEVFPASTGIIGVPLPADKLIKAIPQLLSARAADAEAAERFARAIMTTDTRMKTASARFGAATLFGTCKGAGMIHPRLATMLVYLFTDAEARPRELGELLHDAVHVTFNRMNVDTDTSTNDTVLLLASGAAGPPKRKDFAAALQAVCESLAKQIVADGEGVKHVVNLRIDGARSDAEASQVAKAIGNSMLVKTAWAGADPNWGRVLAAVGYSGVAIDPAKVDIFFGKYAVCRKGVAARFDEETLHAYLSQPVFDVRVTLGRGKIGATFWTCDLTAEYVHINADYHT